MIQSEELISMINQHEGFSQTERDIWIARIQQEGVTDILKDELKTLLQSKIDQEYAELGIELDEGSEEYKTAHQTMISEIDSAEIEFKDLAKTLKQQADQLQKDTSQEMDAAMAESARQAISGNI